jgi:hypothetical protein
VPPATVVEAFDVLEDRVGQLDAMIMDSSPVGERHTVPGEDRAAALASVESQWDA